MGGETKLNSYHAPLGVAATKAGSIEVSAPTGKGTVTHSLTCPLTAVKLDDASSVVHKLHPDTFN
jgi:hypothetical protein